MELHCNWRSQKREAQKVERSHINDRLVTLINFLLVVRDEKDEDTKVELSLSFVIVIVRTVTITTDSQSGKWAIVNRGGKEEGNICWSLRGGRVDLYSKQSMTIM